MIQRFFSFTFTTAFAICSMTGITIASAAQNAGVEMIKMWRMKFYYVGQKSDNERPAWGEFRDSSETSVLANANLAYQVQQAVAAPGLGQMTFGARSKPEEVIVPNNKKFSEVTFPIQNYFSQRIIKIILQTSPKNTVDVQRKADLLAVYLKILQLSARIQTVLDAGPQDAAIKVLKDSIEGFNKLPRPSDYNEVAARLLEEEKLRDRELHKTEDGARTRALIDQVWDSYRKNQQQR